MLVFRLFLFGFGLLATHPAQEKPVILPVTSFFLSEKGNERIREKLLSEWWRAKARASSLRQSFGRIIKASVGITLFS